MIPPTPSATNRVEAPAAPAAPPAPPPSAPPPAPQHPLAFQADFKLPFAVTTLITGLELVNANDYQSPFAPVPQLVLGLHVWRIGVGVGFGFTNFGVRAADGIDSATELLVAPTFTFDVFQSKDAKVALYALAAPVLGLILVNQPGQPVSIQSDIGFQAALGASYALHDNFRVGLEVGPVGHVFNTNYTETVYTMALYTALVGTFAYPR